jgi:hypothetical protein
VVDEISRIEISVSIEMLMLFIYNEPIPSNRNVDKIGSYSNIRKIFLKKFHKFSRNKICFCVFREITKIEYACATALVVALLLIVTYFLFYFLNLYAVCFAFVVKTC